MTSGRDTASFFENGNTKQFEYCFKMYPQVLKLKAENRCKKPQELIRLDQWYQNELPKLIKQRGKDAHMVYDELVQTMKWKQSRGKFYPQLSYLVKVNTPRAVMQETKKAFRKLPNLEQAITALSNLKGVGTTMASALLAAAAPDTAPFMADECLMAIPEIEGIDYTTKEYLNFVQHIQATTARLNSEAGGEVPVWSPHRVELALWSHYVAADLSPDLLLNMPESATMSSSSSSSVASSSTSVTNGVSSSSKIIPNAADADTDVDEDTMPGDEAMGTGTATESETENITDEPSSTLDETVSGNDTSQGVTTTTKTNATNAASVKNSKILNNSTNTTQIISDNDADSNFVSNDSTSQDPIIDENTTHTTATTTTDDGGTPLASDSESNMELPVLSTIIKKANSTTTTTTTTPSAILIDNNTKKSMITVVRNVNNGNGNGAIINALEDEDEENANSCLISRSDDDVDADADDDDTNSRSKCLTPIINMNDSNSVTATSTTTTTLSNSTGKRSLIYNSEDQSNSQPEIKKIRTD